MARKFGGEIMRLFSLLILPRHLYQYSLSSGLQFVTFIIQIVVNILFKQLLGLLLGHSRYLFSAEGQQISWG